MVVSQDNHPTFPCRALEISNYLLEFNRINPTQLNIMLRYMAYGNRSIRLIQFSHPLKGVMKNTLVLQ